MVKWYTPKSIDNVLEILKKEKVIPFSGGTDLMVQHKNYHELNPNFDLPILYLGNVSEFSYIKSNDNSIEIGATTSLTDILNCSLTPKILKIAINQLASPSIRNMGTIGGNIGNASPAGDTLPPLYLLNAKINLLSPDCEKTIPISSFIKGPRQILLDDSEIITSITVDKVPNYNSFYRKIGTRKANSLSKLSVAVIGNILNGTFNDIRISAGAVAPTVVRNCEIEKKLKVIPISKIRENIKEIINLYKPLINPIDDQRSNAVYRKETTLNLIEQGILSIIGD